MEDHKPFEIVVFHLEIQWGPGKFTVCWKEEKKIKNEEKGREGSEDKG